MSDDRKYPPGAVPVAILVVWIAFLAGGGLIWALFALYRFFTGG